jgi:hypothetical protein
MFRLNLQENKGLRLQFATSKKGRGGSRYAPHAFTEHGAIMAATVLNSERAVQMSVFVVRAFVRLREMLATNRRLAGKLFELENRLDTHDSTIQDLIEAIKELMSPEEPSRCTHRLPASSGQSQRMTPHIPRKEPLNEIR